MGLSKTIKATGLLFFLLFHSPVNASASWSGPNGIVSGGWGAGDQNFGFNAGELKDQFAQNILILSNGSILIEDWVNNRLKIYNANGTYVKSIPQLGLGFYELDSDRIISFAWDDEIKSERIGVISLSQSRWLWTDNSKIFDSASAAVAVVNNTILIWDGKKTAYQYSPPGQIIKTYTERPAELGKVIEKPISNAKSKVTVQYPDRTWSYIDVGRQPSYMRDKNGNLYGYGSTQVTRYTTCGKEAASLMMPKKIEQEESRGPQIDPKVTVLEEYGPPVIAPNGDVYTWKRTPTAYSILKWTWVDDPNPPANVPDAPESLNLKIAPTGINLFWKASPQDPGCVTGYEIVRSTIAGGPYSTLATVGAGTANATGWIKHTDTTAEVGTTYYYKVRAAAGITYSPYTAEASGKR